DALAGFDPGDVRRRATGEGELSLTETGLDSSTPEARGEAGRIVYVQRWNACHLAPPRLPSASRLPTAEVRDTDSDRRANGGPGGVRALAPAGRQVPAAPQRTRVPQPAGKTHLARHEARP